MSDQVVSGLLFVICCFKNNQHLHCERLRHHLQLSTSNFQLAGNSLRLIAREGERERKNDDKHWLDWSRW